MQDRVNVQNIFRPQDGEGQRIAIGAVSAISVALTVGKEHQFFVTKMCWINIGDNAVVATANVDFPISAGSVYRYTPRGANDQFIAVVEDALVNGVVGVLAIGQSEV
jgi:hypothetical protein